MQEISIKTERRTQLIEITPQVEQALNGVDGAAAALVYVPHTTAGVTINEGLDPDLARDRAEVALAREAPELAQAPAVHGLADAAGGLERRELGVPFEDRLELERLLQARVVEVVLLVELGDEAVGAAAVAVELAVAERSLGHAA